MEGTKTRLRGKKAKKPLEIENVFIIMQIAVQTGALASCLRIFPHISCIPVLHAPHQYHIQENKIRIQKTEYLRGPPDPDSFLKYSITVALSKHLSWLLKAGSDAEPIVKAPAVLRRKMRPVDEGWQPCF